MTNPDTEEAHPMLDRVALMMMPALDRIDPDARVGELTKREVADLARATLTALLELTPDVRKAGEQEMMARHTNLDCFNDPYVDSTWVAMINHILGESA